MVNQAVAVTAKEFASKFREKHEVYHFLSHECGVYLPAYDVVTVWHMRDLVSGSRLKIYGKDIQHISVPCYDDLAIKDILKFGRQYTNVNKALPIVEKETLKMPRQYLANIVYTIAG
jgi:hypothetical protein